MDEYILVAKRRRCVSIEGSLERIPCRLRLRSRGVAEDPKVKGRSKAYKEMI